MAGARYYADVARRLISLEADQGIAQRVLELGEKANEGLLSLAERREYEAYIQANDFIAILQSKARQVLQRHAE